MRIGIGYDIHRLVEGRNLVLGGVEIPYIKGLEGHSDADVLLHAICDAMLGAAGLGDIGRHFPDRDPQFKNASSMGLLKEVFGAIKQKKFRVNNIDVVIIAEEPKLEPFKNSMVDKISRALDAKPDAVNIKATTGEGVGSIGRGEAMASYAVCTLIEEREAP